LHRLGPKIGMKMLVKMCNLQDFSNSEGARGKLEGLVALNLLVSTVAK